MEAYAASVAGARALAGDDGGELGRGRPSNARSSSSSSSSSSSLSPHQESRRTTLATRTRRHSRDWERYVQSTSRISRETRMTGHDDADGGLGRMRARADAARRMLDLRRRAAEEISGDGRASDAARRIFDLRRRAAEEGVGDDIVWDDDDNVDGARRRVDHLDLAANAQRPHANDDVSNNSTLSSLSTEERVERNDPSLAVLRIGTGEGCNLRAGSDVDWTELGTNVASNTHLKELEFSGLRTTPADGDAVSLDEEVFERFFTGLFGGGAYTNTIRPGEATSTPESGSIQSLVLKDSDLDEEMVFQDALPFLAHNKCVRCLVVDQCDSFVPQGEVLHRFLSAFSWRVSPDLRSVRVLRVLPSNGLNGNMLGNSDMLVAMKALAFRSGAITKYLLWRGRVERSNDPSEHAALALLLNESNDLLVLDLHRNCMDGEGAERLRGGRSGVPIVEEDVTWRSVLFMLRSPGFLYGCGFSAMNAAPEDRWNNQVLSSLRTLHFGRNPSMGAQAVYDLLRSPGCVLKELNFGGHNLTDETVAPLLEALADNSSLKSLNLSGSLRQVTRTTWQGIATLLRNQKSGLEKLNLCYSPINNDALLAFTCALSDNKKVTELLLYNSSDWNTRWESFSRLLCDKSSMMETFQSNHTLQRVTNGANQPSPLQTHLEMNEGDDKFDVARRKIVATHFTGDMDVDMRHFIDMDFGVLPRAISWMAGGEVSLFYDFVRNMPLFFESGGRNGSEGSRNVKRQKKDMVIDDSTAP